jgi:hypothetical protein
MRKMLYVLVIVLVSVAPLSAHASQLVVSSYSMYNGGTGSYDYRDFTYVPCNGACDMTGAFLSGGTGKLTDGVSPPLSWYQYGSATPWVGWYPGQLNGSNPTITFNFPGTVNINSVTVWVDNTIGYGGVYLPSSVSVGATNFPIAPDNSNPNPRGYTFSGLNITGNSVNVQFFQTSGDWIMVGEVSFNGTQAVPLPPALLLFGSGIAGLAAVRRRLKN